MPKRKICAECGKSNANKDRFCGDCGKPLSDVPLDDKPLIKLLDATALDALASLSPHEKESSAADMTLPLFPEEPISADDGVTDDSPAVLPVPDTGFKEIEITCLQGTDIDTRTLLRDGEIMSVGSSADARLCLKDDPYVSRRHLTISRYDDKILVEDTDSSNGTYVRIDGPTPVPVGSILLVGKHLLQIVGSK